MMPHALGECRFASVDRKIFPCCFFLSNENLLNCVLTDPNNIKQNDVAISSMSYSLYCFDML